MVSDSELSSVGWHSESTKSETIAATAQHDRLPLKSHTLSLSLFFCQFPRFWSGLPRPSKFPPYSAKSDDGVK